MFAALLLSEQGYRVALLEFQPEETYMATGNESCGVNSNLVNKITEGNQYHDVDPVEYYQNWMTMIGNQGNPGLIMRYCQNMGDNIDWYYDSLTDSDIATLSHSGSPAAGETWPHLLPNIGPIKFYPGVISAYAEECNQTKIQGYNREKAKAAGAEFFFNTRGLQILQDNGKVSGVIAENRADGSYLKFSCKAVVVATGSKSVVPDSIPGVHGANVHTIEEVLSGKVSLSGKQTVVIGAGNTGIETAEYLCAAGNTVTIVDQLDKVAPTANHTNVADICGRLNQHGAKFLLAHSLKEIRENQVVLERLVDHAEVTVSADAVVLSLGFRPDNALAEELRAKSIETVVVGSAVKDGTIAPATRSGYEAGRQLFRPMVKAPSFRVPAEDLPNFGKVSLMKNQEGVYLAYLTDPAAIARLLPPPLKPFSIPVVTLSVCHVKEPTFADDYYEAILGVYATYGTTLGLYPLGLVLGGPGAEMAVQCGRDNGSIPKKLGAEFVIRRSGDSVTAQVTRRGTQLVDL
ncbi:FAD-dependent oxidoreductase, partial [Oscillibacter sp.]|uniref:FAD-dependent oxidoreductase n=1 Tax=Oscillibacter sp. TaxID=1945593 RepID=UPI002D800C9C